MELNLRGGALLIGSLYWQKHLNKPGDNIRKKWRDTRLERQTTI